MLGLFAAFALGSCAGQEAQASATPVQAMQDLAACGPLPSARQLAWSELDFYAFVHFNMNTFSGREWGKGDESPALFAPSALDCRQWARVAVAAGMRGIILTAKHHDGFCLWPSKYTSHSVASSPWREGRGDVLRELSDACREAGLKFGVYLSPWDRHSPLYGDSPKYNDFYAAQLEEVLGNYGEVFEVWWDGACAEGPNGKRQVYDFERFTRIVRRLQPEAVIFSDIGPDVRWVGNESGLAGETCWSMLDTAGFSRGLGAPPTQALNEGQRDGAQWLPAECDVSIRPGWYYHAEQDGRIKSLASLFDIYERSVGHNASLLLNLPVDRRGLVHENDAARLVELRAQIDATYAADPARRALASASDVHGSQPRFAAANAVDGDPRSYWAASEGAREPALSLRLPAPAWVDRVVLREPIALGQRVERFRLEALVEGSWRALGAGTTIGNRRIVRTPLLQVEGLRLTIEAARATPAIASFELGCTPPQVVARAERACFLDSTRVELSASQAAASIRYTLDGSEPTPESTLYEGELEVAHTAKLRARAFRGTAQGVEIAQLELRRFERSELRPAMHFLRAPAPGLRWSCHAADSLLRADEDSRPAQASGEALRIEFAQAGCAAADGIAFDGVFEAGADGVFEFAIEADFAALLEIDGTLLLDSRAGESRAGESRAGESHAGESHVGEGRACVALERGWHALRLRCGPRGESVRFNGTWNGPHGGGDLLTLPLHH